MHALISEKKPVYQSAIEHLQKELSQLRTGRATPALVENIPVSAYGSVMEVKGLASVQVHDAKTLVIEPWDKGILMSIEKAIRDAGVGLSPAVDGHIIRIVLPQMTEENRKQIAKVAKERLEDTRIRIRAVREEAREKVNAMEKGKEISEDEKFKLFDEIDKMTKEFTDLAMEIGKKKDEEIMTL